MSYVNSVLGSDESVLYEANVSLLPFLYKFIFGFSLLIFGIISFTIPFYERVGTIQLKTGLGIALLICGILILIQPFIVKETTELVITNRRIIAKFGLISRYTIEINLPKVESISVSQTMMGRILNYGDLEIVGTGGTREPIPYVRYPLVFRRKFDEILNS